MAGNNVYEEAMANFLKLAPTTHEQRSTRTTKPKSKPKPVTLEDFLKLDVEIPQNRKLLEDQIKVVKKLLEQKKRLGVTTPLQKEGLAQTRTMFLKLKAHLRGGYTETDDEETETDEEKEEKKVPIKRVPVAVSASPPKKQKEVSLKQANLLPFTRVRHLLQHVVSGLNARANLHKGFKVGRTFIVELNRRMFEWIDAVLSNIIIVRHTEDADCDNKHRISEDEIKQAVEALCPGLLNMTSAHKKATLAYYKKPSTSLIVHKNFRFAMKTVLHNQHVSKAAVELFEQALFLRTHEMLTTLAEQLERKKRVVFKVCPPLVSLAKSKAEQQRFSRAQRIMIEQMAKMHFSGNSDTASVYPFMNVEENEDEDFEDAEDSDANDYDDDADNVDQDENEGDRDENEGDEWVKWANGEESMQGNSNTAIATMDVEEGSFDEQTSNQDDASTSSSDDDDTSADLEEYLE